MQTNDITQLEARRDELMADLNKGGEWGAAQTAKHEELQGILKNLKMAEVASADEGSITDVPEPVAAIILPAEMVASADAEPITDVLAPPAATGAPEPAGVAL